MSQLSRRPHRRRPTDAWGRIRSDYAAGVPARVSAERGGVSLSALRTRARKEGWRRSDGCGPPAPADWAPDMEASLEGDPALLAEEAWLNAARHLHLGRLAEASAWARMAAHCRRAARDAAREESATLAALTRLLGQVGKPMGHMHTAKGEAIVLQALAKVTETLLELGEAPAPSGPAPGRSRPRRPAREPAPECESQTPDAQPLSGELHLLHTPARPAHRTGDVQTSTQSAHPRAGGAPGVSGPSPVHAPDPVGPVGPDSASLSKKAWVPACAGMSGEEGQASRGPEIEARTELAADDPPLARLEPAPPSATPPWAALMARPEPEASWAERCVRRRVADHGLAALFDRDRPEALRRWTRWVAEFAIDPDRPPRPDTLSSRRRAAASGTPCVSPAPHLHPGFRVVLP